MPPAARSCAALADTKTRRLGQATGFTAGTSTAAVLSAQINILSGPIPKFNTAS